MTLRCECGGIVECQAAPGPGAEPPVTELYECLECGRTGTYHMTARGTDDTNGCLTVVQEDRI